MEIGYFNGNFVSLDEKVIPIDERGHQFGDGVYEVIRIYNGKPFMVKEHLQRLQKSAKEIRLSIPSESFFQDLILKGIEKSHLQEAYIYLQITRGIAPRNHLFPNVSASISMTVRKAKRISNELREKGAGAIFHADERWANCYIKSLNLLPNILAKQTAHDKGCFEAILVKDGYVTEGSSSNVFIVKDKSLYTTPLSKQILAGITRMAVEKAAKLLNIPFVEKKFTPEELLAADEVFITSTTTEILPITSVDGKIIHKGVPGETTKTLYAQFQKMVKDPQ